MVVLLLGSLRQTIEERKDAHMPYNYFTTKEFKDKYYYTGNDLGVTYQKSHSIFRVWAPLAESVSLILFPTGNDSKGKTYPMKAHSKGTWVLNIPGDLNGIYYNFLVTNSGVTREAVDPYARACGVNGQRGMVVDLSGTNPEGWEQLQTAPLDHFVDIIIYELSVRDFTHAANSKVVKAGKFLGLTETGTKYANLATGLDHLKELGITHVQLMPCYDFFTIDESKLHSAEYNWGYDPQNYNVPEGSYATDPYHGAVRILELKQMIKSLKEANFRIIMDVVYNHTYLSEDSHLNKIVPGYYYRHDAHGNFTDGSGCGNELASERSMVRKMITDSVVYWATEYKIDGFRFDLMGLMDILTINEIRQALNEVDQSIFMYGEGWIGGHSPLPDHKKALKGNVRQLPGTGVFNDDVRDAIKGHVFFAEQPGFVNGATGMEESVKCGIVGATDHDQIDYDQVLYSHFPWAAEPSQSINYASSHDNLTLWDKLLVTNAEDSVGDLISMHKMAGAIVLTSQGIPFLHSGVEMLRTKHGDYNSYRSPDWINEIDWARKKQYQSVFKYFQGLIQLRKTHPAFRLTTAEQIKTCLRFMPMPAGHMLGYQLLEANNDPWKKIVVIFNANKTGQIVTGLPGNHWVMVVNQEHAGIERLGVIKDFEVLVPPLTSLVLVNGECYGQGDI